MKKKIKINFTDFWQGFDPVDNYFYNLLIEEFDVEISDNPDYLFFSLFGNAHQAYNCVKIQYVGENIAPALNYADYCFSFDYINDDKNYRLPHYLLYDGYYKLLEKEVDENLLNRGFCNFMVSNGNCLERNNFFNKLSKYKRIDSGGRHYNNIGFLVSDKREFQSKYKFSIAYENNAYRPQHEGYITEKVMEPMTVNSIPIYWGCPDIGRDFNTKSFISFYDFKNEDEMIDYIKFLDQNDDEYMKKLQEPWFNNNQIPEKMKLENIKAYLYKIFD